MLSEKNLIVRFKLTPHSGTNLIHKFHNCLRLFLVTLVSEINLCL